MRTSMSFRFSWDEGPCPWIGSRFLLLLGLLSWSIVGVGADGSGGARAKRPALRRVAFAFARLDAEGDVCVCVFI